MPGLGATGGSRFQLSAGWRYAAAHQSYFNSRYNHDFTSKWDPHVKLSILDITARYRLNRRASLLCTVPIVFNHADFLVPPLGPGRGLRNDLNTQGLGDISLYGQSYLFDPKDHPFENIALGAGIKCPTGDWDVRRVTPDLAGRNLASRAVFPPAIMPGDGGTGILVGFDGYKVFRAPKILRGQTLFASGSYLINPRITNGTASIVNYAFPAVTPNFLNELTNSVADSYNVQVGMALKIPGTWDKKWLKGTRFRVTGRCEGLNTNDLIGKSKGFRQPGYAMAVGPGLTYQYGRDLFIIDVPIVFNRHINPGRSAVPGPYTIARGVVRPAPFNPRRNFGTVAPVSISFRYVRTF